MKNFINGNWKVLLVIMAFTAMSFQIYDKIVVRSIRFTENPQFGTPGDSSLLYKRSDGLVGRTEGASGETAMASTDSLTVVNGIITAIH